MKKAIHLAMALLATGVMLPPKNAWGRADVIPAIPGNQSDTQPSVQNPKVDKRIRLLLSTVETPDTRIDITDPVPLPPLMVPYSDADLQGMDGDRLARAQRENAYALSQYHANTGRIFTEEYRRRVALQRQIYDKAKGTKTGRNLLLARDWFGASMQPYDNLFVRIFRMDTNVADFEKNLANVDVSSIGKAACFIKLVINDPHQKEEMIRLPGNVTQTRVTTSQLVTAVVQNLQSEILFSKNIEIKDERTRSNVVTATGSDDVLGEIIRKCLDQVAKEVAAHFSVQFSLKIRGPQGDPDFDVDYAVVALDGKEILLDKPVTCLKTEYTIKVEMDGYEPQGRTFDFSGEEDTVVKTIIMKKKQKHVTADE